MKEEHYRIAKIILAIAFLGVAYLAVLNGRYEINQKFMLVDKWTGEFEVIQEAE